MHIREVLNLDRLASLDGGESAVKATRQGQRLLADIEDWCLTKPRPPPPPKGWPPPPNPPWGDSMGPAEQLVFGGRFLVASDLLEQVALRNDMSQLGEKVVGASTQG